MFAINIFKMFCFQIIGPLKTDEVFITEDFNLLDKYTMKTSAEKIKTKVKPLKLDEKQ